MKAWKIDKPHSEITMKVRHMMIANVTIRFDEIDLHVESSDDSFTNTNIEFVAKVDSINTNNSQRDEHLRSGDFFEVDKYPEITFSATGVDITQGSIKGDLTIREVTKEVTVEVDFAGTGQDPYGNLKAGFSIAGKIKRTDFGLTWNVPLEKGGVLVSEEVRMNAEVQLYENVAVEA